MSQAPSVVFAARCDDHLAGVPPDVSVEAPGGPSAPAGEASREGEAIARAGSPLSVESASSVSLRGTTRGLEILISGAPSTAVLAARLAELFAEAPGFFAGSTARVAIDGALPVGALACLEDVATRFEVQIVEIAPVIARRRRCQVPAVLRPEDVPEVHLAEGTGPIADQTGEPHAESAPAHEAPPVTPDDAARAEAAPADAAPGDAAPAEAQAETAPAEAQAETAPVATTPGDAPRSEGAPASAAAAIAALPPGPRLVIGPVRSGRIVDHTGHLIVMGDVNPGAEVRAEGSIIVLGRLRGVAHAAIGREAGCIIALSLQPQQLRIGRMVARAADADRPSDGAEIAYATGETIVVERFLGRLPSGLAASM